MPVSSLQQALIDWYTANRRELPWRQSSDPYAIWVSEVMLQQTQVATVVPFYKRWMKRFPSVVALAESSEDHVLQEWQGLGYYRRAKWLLAGARFVVENGFPKDLEGWLDVPGVGRYTAGAICSIALGQAVPVVDGNVERVFARTTANSSEKGVLHREAWVWAESLMFHEDPGAWNQALMELGATICTPTDPRCDICPLNQFCLARGTRQPELFPARQLKRPTSRLEHLVWVAWCKGRFGLRRIEQGKWWTGMWEFPRETNDETGRSRLRELLPDAVTQPLTRVRHTVTHHRIFLEACWAECEEPHSSLQWLEPAELLSIALPAPQRKIASMALSAWAGQEAGFKKPYDEQSCNADRDAGKQDQVRNVEDFLTDMKGK